MGTNGVMVRVGAFVERTLVDGPGERTSVYFQGCPIRCVGCQSPHLFEATGGTEMHIGEVASRLIATNLPVSILGGEPFAQPYQLALLVRLLAIAGVEVAVYSGYTWEQLERMSRDEVAIADVLLHADTLVEGPFQHWNMSSYDQWRGSSNQRPVNLAAMRATGKHPLDVPLILHEWDADQELVISENGTIIGVEGLINDLLPWLQPDAEHITLTRQCGDLRSGRPHI